MSPLLCTSCSCWCRRLMDSPGAAAPRGLGDLELDVGEVVAQLGGEEAVDLQVWRPRQRWQSAHRSNSSSGGDTAVMSVSVLWNGGQSSLMPLRWKQLGSAAAAADTGLAAASASASASIAEAVVRRSRALARAAWRWAARRQPAGRRRRRGDGGGRAADAFAEEAARGQNWYGMHVSVIWHSE